MQTSGFLLRLPSVFQAQELLCKAGMELADPSSLHSMSMSSNETFKVMTYNVHSCIGTDSKLSLNRVVDVIDQCGADVVCLQELDVGRLRSSSIDQALHIADGLGMQFHFHPAMSRESEHYGDAILSRHPFQLHRAEALPGLESRPHLEPRGALWVSITWQGTEIHLFNTHLGLAAKERQVQMDALCGPQWLGHPDCRGPVILCGDLNAVPASSVYRKLRRQLRDAQRSLCRHWAIPTFPSRFPVLRIDHLFINELLDVAAIHVPKDPLTRLASDHLPLVVDLRLRGN